MNLDGIGEDSDLLGYMAEVVGSLAEVEARDR